jgi:2-hydroxychromene-2-carboxylate isomerase
MHTRADRPDTAPPAPSTRPPRTLEFWYDFASTYTYLSVRRIGPLASAAAVEIVWRPILLGAIFNEQGWSTSPFVLYPAKGRYMVRDVSRIARDRGDDFYLPDPFPANGLAAARIALVAEGEGWIGPFTERVMAAEFSDRLDIAEPSVLETIVTTLGHDFARVFDRSRAEDTKAALREQTTLAARHGIFGAPTFRTSDGELFWGDDRLEQALRHACEI